MGGDAVESVSQAIFCECAVALGDGGIDVVGPRPCFFFGGGRSETGDARVCHRFAEGVEAFAGSGADACDWTVEEFGKYGLVDVDASLAGEVDHVDGDDDGESSAEGFSHEHEAAGEVHGIGDDQDRVGSFGGFAARADGSGEHASADFGFGLVEFEGVDAREIDEDGAIGPGHGAEAGFERGAGEVC